MVPLRLLEVLEEILVLVLRVVCGVQYFAFFLSFDLFTTSGFIIFMLFASSFKY